MKPWLQQICGDLFGIADRLHGIDAGYFVVYNRKAHRYEVHHARQAGDTLALCVPYGSLDARTETLVRKTRSERVRALEAEAEEHNRKLECAVQRAATERMTKKI